MADDTKFITINDSSYPALLQQAYSPPKQLYVRGNVELLQHDKLLAVVGSRKGNAYGQQAIKKLLTPVVKAGIPLISGLAYGIDSMAHRICLDNDVPTIAVLGSGLDDKSLYPRRHVKLAHEIVDAGGAIVTEYPAGTAPFLGYFPARNRIIAALAQSTLVVQAAIKSGSLITARLAVDMGKDVLAVPGPITDSLSSGTNQLIQQGATPALEAQDILDYFGLAQEAKAPVEHQLNANQQLLLGKLSAQPQHIDELVKQTNLPSPTVSATLLELEMIEAALSVGGMQYIKNDQ